MSKYQSVFSPNLFEGQIIIVTGGGSGIGRCISHELAALGASVMLFGRTLEELEKVQAEIAEDGGYSECYPCDVRDEEVVQALVEKVVAQHGHINGLVNNAGGQFPSPLEKISKKGFEAVVSTNLTGGFLMAREVFEQSMKAQGGAIVNVTADCDNGLPMMGHTGAARAGMENLIKTAAWEWGRYCVRINSVAPGFVASSGMDTYDEANQKRFLECINGIPQRRFGTESEISSAVCFLLSPAAAYINGANLRVDGGSHFGNALNIYPLPEGAGKPAEAFNGFHRATMPRMLLKDSE